MTQGVDTFDEELISHVSPIGRRNPSPKAVYNLVVIGAGSAGLVSAFGAAGLGASVAIIERRKLGGDCLNYGCVPSKALISVGRAAHNARTANSLGVLGANEAQVDFDAAMSRLRRLRAGISKHDSVGRLEKTGVDVFFGDARFTGTDTVEVGGQTLRFRRCVIAAGGGPAVPNVPGLAEAGFVTNENVFSLTQLPRRLAVIGAGPIGCELGQTFRRFGSEVHVIVRDQKLMQREEPEAVEIVEAAFKNEGIFVHRKTQLVKVEKTNGAKLIHVRDESGAHAIEADEILVAIGRKTDLSSLNLQAAHVTQNERGVVINDFFRTTNSKVYAAGDCVGSFQFTHAADAMARATLQNAFFFGQKRLSQFHIPHCTYVSPEVARIGLTAADAKQKGIEIDTHMETLDHVDRAILDGETDGFAMIHCRKGTGKIVGATIVANHAGDLLAPLVLAMTNGVKLDAIAGTVHSYPTQAEVVKRVADKYRRTKLTPRVASILKTILRWR